MDKRSKRKDFQDSEIMNALDACEYSVGRAAQMLGVAESTLYRWINDSENLKKYKAYMIETHALLARSKVEQILKHADYLDPKQMGHIISAAKLFMDKAEASKLHLEGEVSLEAGLNAEATDLLKKLLDEEQGEET